MTHLYVPDASVLLKWVVPREAQEHVDHAEAMSSAFAEREIDLCVPTLWYFEVGNVLRRKFPKEASNLLNELLALRLREHAISQQIQSVAIELVVGKGVTFYDAVYHALAIVRSGVFVTADTKYFHKVGPGAGIRHLRDWPAA